MVYALDCEIYRRWGLLFLAALAVASVAAWVDHIAGFYVDQNFHDGIRCVEKQRVVENLLDLVAFVLIDGRHA